MKKRQGFTLVELLMVIAIIAVLVSLLTVAVGAAMRRAHVASVKQEIEQFDYALSDFKAHFGDYPPSNFDFRLYSTPTGGTPDVTGNYLHPASAATLRRFWPNINLTPPPPPPAVRDPALLIVQLQDNPQNQKVLDGHSSLVFWLGGVVIDPQGQPMGFSTNPRTPLFVSAESKRVGPFFEFQPDRLHDANPAAFDGYEGYLDPLPGQQKPYWYITSRNYQQQAETNTTLATDGDSTNDQLMRPIYKPDYSSFFFPQKFQLVSPGYDYEYGSTRVYDPEKPAFVEWSVPTDPSSTKTFVTEGPEADNITNFASGPLVE